MNRRESLKKLAGAGVGIAASPLILSSLAHADTGSTNCQFTYGTPVYTQMSFTLDVTGQNKKTGRIWMHNIVPPAAVCPCGGPAAGGGAIIDYQVGWIMQATNPDNNGVQSQAAVWGNFTITNQASNFDTGLIQLRPNGATGDITFNWWFGVAFRARCNGFNNNPSKPAVICRFYENSGTTVQGIGNSYVLQPILPSATTPESGTIGATTVTLQGC